MTVGLGRNDQVDELRVIWPDGSGERFPGRDAGQIITLEKGGGKTVE